MSRVAEKSNHTDRFFCEAKKEGKGKAKLPRTPIKQMKLAKWTCSQKRRLFRIKITSELDQVQIWNRATLKTAKQKQQNSCSYEICKLIKKGTTRKRQVNKGYPAEYGQVSSMSCCEKGEDEVTS